MMKLFIVLLCSVIVYGCDYTERDWQNTKTENTVEAYERFIELHPDTPQTNLAKHEIIELHYKNANEINSLVAYASFLKRYPSSHRSKDIEDHFNNLIDKAVDASFHLIYEGNLKVNYESKTSLFGEVIFDPTYYEKARKILEEVIIYDSKHAIALNNLAALKTANHEFDDTLELLTRAKQHSDMYEIKKVKLDLWVNFQRSSSSVEIVQPIDGEQIKYKSVSPTKDPPSSSPFAVMYMHYHNQWWARKVEQTNGKYLLSPIIQTNIENVNFLSNGNNL